MIYTQKSKKLLSHVWVLFLLFFNVKLLHLLIKWIDCLFTALFNHYFLLFHYFFYTIIRNKCIIENWTHINKRYTYFCFLYSNTHWNKWVSIVCNEWLSSLIELMQKSYLIHISIAKSSLSNRMESVIMIHYNNEWISLSRSHYWRKLI